MFTYEYGFTDPDNGDGYDDDNPESVSDEELELKNISDDEFISELDEKISEENSSKDFVEIGVYGTLTAKIITLDNCEPKEFINMSVKANKLAILSLTTVNDFDSFTVKYGIYKKKKNKVYINWDYVHRKYKGIYVASSVLKDREETIPYNDTNVDNWIYYDFGKEYLDKVLIFQHYRNIIHKKEVKHPFHGYVVDSFGINENEYVRFNEKADNKILFIDDVKSFDKFTKAYGYVKDETIIIDWDKVKKHYSGITIDKDNFFEKNRKTKAYYNEQLCTSWWNDNIVAGLVYLFR